MSEQSVQVPSSNIPLMATVEQNGFEFTAPRWVRINLREDIINRLVGRIKTIIDAAGLGDVQRKAVKDILTQEIWDWMCEESRDVHELYDDRCCPAAPRCN